jgi:hypothetical protein
LERYAPNWRALIGSLTVAREGRQLANWTACAWSDWLGTLTSATATDTAAKY